MSLFPPVVIIWTMKKELPGRIFFLSAYLLLAIGFLVIHFTRVEKFSSIADGITVEGVSSTATALSPPQIWKVSIKTNGLILKMGKINNPAVLVTDDGIKHKLKIRKYEKLDNKIIISFSNNVKLIIKTDLHSNTVTIAPEIPQTSPPVRSLEFSLSPVKGTGITVDRNRPGILNIKNGDSEFVISLPKDSSWNPEKDVLNLVVLNKANPVIEISKDLRGGGLNAAGWLEKANTPSEAFYDKVVSSWLEKTLAYWQKNKDSKTGLWFNPEGKPEWNDKIASAVLAEAVKNKSIGSVLPDIVNTANHAKDKTGWLSSPYLGNIIRQSESLQNRISMEADSLISGIKQNTPDYSISGGIRILVDTSNSSYAEQLYNSAKEVSGNDIPNKEILERINLLQEARELKLFTSENDTEKRKDIFDRYVIPRIFWVKDGLWLIEEDGSVNLRRSVSAGTLLMKEALWNNENTYQTIGRQLIISALAYAGEDGSIPEKLLFEADGNVVKEGKYSPENLYPMLIRSGAYPRLTTLSGTLGAGSWALTCAENFTVRSTPRETTISMNFPVGTSHHIAVKGIKKFNVLYMNGIRWNGDPNFQRYYGGWYYNEKNETLYIKIRHKRKNETIRILYYTPEELNNKTP